jgi:hypothetical protein
MECNLIEFYAMCRAVVMARSEKIRLYGEPGVSDLPLVCMRMYSISFFVVASIFS